MTIVGKISKSKYIILIPIIIFIVYLTHTMRNINLEQKISEAKRLVRRSPKVYDLNTQQYQPNKHLKQLQHKHISNLHQQQPKQQLKQPKQHLQQFKQLQHHQQIYSNLKIPNNRKLKMLDLTSLDIENKIKSRVKRQSPTKKKTPAKTTATTTTTTTTTKAPIVIVEAQIHEQPQEVLPTLVPIPTLSTYTLKPSVLEKSVRKTEIKLVNPEGETITFPTSDIADLSVESLSNLLQAEMIDAQAPATIKFLLILKVQKFKFCRKWR